MSLIIVQAIRANYPTPLGARHLELLEAVARATALGLVQKTSGTFIPHPTAGGVSQDVLMDRSGAAVDVLIDADGAANPAWQLIAPIDPSRYVSVSNGQPPIPDPEPPVPPTPPVPQPDLSKILEKIDTLQQSVGAIQGMLREMENIALSIEEKQETSILGLRVITARQDRAYAGKLGFSIRLTPERNGGAIPQQK